MKRKVNVGGIVIGDGSVSIQSMTNTKTKDVDATVAQIVELQRAGCQLVRCSVPDEESAAALSAKVSCTAGRYYEAYFGFAVPVYQCGA